METTFLPRWVVWSICTKSVDVRDNLLYGITVWRLRKGKNQEKEIVKTREEGRNQPDSQRRRRRRKKKPWQKEDGSSKGLKGGQRYTKTD
jgi:hypothetical protein